MHVTALEPSVALLSMLEDQSIRKVIGKIPDLNLDPNESFLLSISHTCCHLVGETIRESHNIGKESLLLREIIWTTQVLDHPKGAIGHAHYPQRDENPRVLSSEHSQQTKHRDSGVSEQHTFTKVSRG